ncbi:hypothetical protein [Halorussus sp. AFM4]|uniref:hypothetical protein n=1 Tax=Halorussus sp. AFM4 TaxID=3421651 RepID=UPI003EBEBBF1
MNGARLLCGLLVVLSAATAGAVPAAVGAAPTADAATVDLADDAASAGQAVDAAVVDGATARAASVPTLVSIRTELNETQPEAGSNFTLTTHVENVAAGDGSVFVESVEVRETRGGEKVVADEPDRRLWSGGHLRNNQSMELDRAGDHTLYVHVTFRNEDGNDYQVVHPVDVTVYDPHPLLSVATEPTVSGGQTTLNVSLTNGIDERIRNVELRLTSDEVTVEDNRRSLARLAATTTETFAFDVTGDTGGTANLTAALEYTTANGTHRSVSRRLTPTFTELSNPGAVNLTGVSVTRRGRTLQVTGSASNVGTTDVLSAVVGVGSNADVGPGQSTAEYFVGEIPASDFSSFKVRARLTANASTVTIPLRVTYIVDGVRRVRTVPIEYDVPETAPEQPANSSSGPPLALLGVGLVAVVALAAGWRWVRGD